MLEKDDVNKTNSVVKSAIDAWYEKNLASYDSYIADTVFCNDRRIKDLGGWNKTSGLLSTTLQFKGSDTTIDLSCKSETDQFSVSNGKAKLKYKVGLPTKSEVELMKSWSSDTSNYWSLSPIKFDTNMFMNASREASRVNNQNNIRPVISLIAGVEYVEGEGSMDYPYIVDLDK